MKYRQLLEIAGALRSLGSIKFTVKTSVFIGQCQGIVRDDLMLYDKKRLELADEIGQPSEDGSGYKFMKDDGTGKEVIDPVKIRQFNEAMKELEETDCREHRFPRIMVADLVDKNGKPVDVEGEVLGPLLDVIIFVPSEAPAANQPAQPDGS